MSVLLCHGLPAYGHLFPLLPLAAAARSAGHDVVFVTGVEFAPVIRSFGFEVVPAGLSPQDVARDLFGGPVPRRHDGRANVEGQRALFLEELPRRTVGALRNAFAVVDPDLVLYEHTSVGGALAAASLGLPTASLGIVSGATTNLYDPTLSSRFGELLAANGLDSEVDLRPERALDPFPASLRTGPQSPWPSLPVRPTAWESPLGSTPRWLAESRRTVVYLTLGTVFGTADTLRRTASGLARLGVEVVVAPGSVSAGDLGPLPPGVHVEGFVDQARILPLVDAVVHHGGSGTTLGAAAAGLPQLVLPSGADQHANGEAVSAAGAGRFLEPGEVTPAAVATAVNQLLNDSTYVAAASRLQREIAAMPSPRSIVREIFAALPAAA